MSFVFKIILLILLWFNLITCSGKPSGGPGLCALSCDSASLASTDSNLRILDESDNPTMTVSCTGISPGEPYSGKIPLRFMFTRKAPIVITPGVPGDDPKTMPPQEVIIPMPNISFNPLILAGSLPTSDGGDTLYRGILTPQEEWCTDSCGVGALDIQPTCEQDPYDLQILIQSGSKGKIFTIRVEP